MSTCCEFNCHRISNGHSCLRTILQKLPGITIIFAQLYTIEVKYDSYVNLQFKGEGQ